MGFPAARLTDMTATSDVITAPGVPNVLIGSLPASVMGDLVTGPVVVGAITANCSMTVLIGARPAAHLGSVVTGANPQTGVPVTTAVMQPLCMTVLLGA